MVSYSKSLPYPLVTSHVVLDTTLKAMTREAIKIPLALGLPAINHFLEELMHQKLP